MQALGALPEDLVTRILRAASARLAEQVRLLPTTFYTAAVHAAFPTIHDDRSVCVCASDLNLLPARGGTVACAFACHFLAHDRFEGYVNGGCIVAGFPVGQALLHPEARSEQNPHRCRWR